MIVKKVRLENWAIFREPTEVEFSDGLNILYGPNDIGKTTLIDSIRTVFFTKYTSHSEKVRSLIPWGSTLSPKATITFFQNGAHHRITKRFISSEMSLLEKLIDNKWTRIAEGDSADKKVIELVGGKLPTRGDTKPEFWGIGQALWMVQGKPFVSEDLNEETLSSLQKLIGAAIETNQEKDMFGRINERFSSIFTGVRRELKKGSEIKNLEEKIGLKLKKEFKIRFKNTWLNCCRSPYIRGSSGRTSRFTCAPLRLIWFAAKTTVSWITSPKSSGLTVLSLSLAKSKRLRMIFLHRATSPTTSLIISRRSSSHNSL